MGMYTEFHFNVNLNKDVPQEVVDVLAYMVREDYTTPRPPTPEHKLFKTHRWEVMLLMDSYYFAADTYSTLRSDDIGGDLYLCIRCNLKNYDQEIELFVDWIRPYIHAEEGDFLGFSRYEESEDPELIRK